MECAIPLIKAHRVGTSLSIESIDDSLARSRSHTSDSISSSTSSTPTTKAESRSNSDSRIGTEQSPVSRSPTKSPADAPKFDIGSVKSGEVVENGTVDSTGAGKESQSQDQINNGEWNRNIDMYMYLYDCVHVHLCIMAKHLYAYSTPSLPHIHCQ